MLFFFSPVWTPLKTLVLSILLSIIHAKYTIFSTPVQVTFDEYSALKQVRLRFMTEAPFYKTDFMMISFSQALQDTITVPLTFSLINDFAKQIATGTFVFTPDATIIGPYGMAMFKNGIESSYISDLTTATWYTNSNEIASQWLTLIIKVPRNLANIFLPRLSSVSMAIVSSLNPQSVKYQYSNAMSYFYFANLIASPPPQDIDASVANSNPDYAKSGQASPSSIPGALYPIYMEFIPKKNFKDFVLNIEFTSLTLAQVLASTVAPNTLDFTFQGTCYFICKSSITCINALSCTVKEDRVQVSISELIMNQKYVLRFTVLNPPYTAAKNFLIWSDAVGTIYDTVNVVSLNAPSTAPIAISVAEEDLKLLWKIKHSDVRDTMKLGFFIDGGINTVEFAFQISTGSPFGEVLEVTVDVGTTQLIMESIQHNLPCVNTTISYDFSAPPLLVIKNVTALTRNISQGFKYWIAFRARHSLAIDDPLIDNTGMTTIKLARYPTKVLFTPPTMGYVRARIPWVSFKDIKGFHADPLDPTNALGANTLFKNYDTQIFSSTDNGLQNGTSEAMRKYLNDPTTVGIDASIVNQQLIFLLKAPNAFPNSFRQASFSLLDRFETRIYFNPNVFQSVSKKGLQVIAYNQGPNHPTDSKWQTKGNQCYTDQAANQTFQTYMCQKYNDHAQPAQIDNVLDATPGFSSMPFYRFECGDTTATGGSIRCNKTIGSDCVAECTIFKGYDSTLGQWMGGVASIRNATFIPNYQSPIQASDTNLDFIVAFYHNTTLVSASLINAYTVNFDNLQQATVSLINTYHDQALWNQGERVPTLIKIEGKLALSEYVKLQYPDKMRLYIPGTSAIFDKYLVNHNQLGCSYVCKLNKSLSTTVSENWLEMTSVVVENMPTLTNDFKVLLPVELIDDLMSVYVGFEVQGRLVTVYRFGGSVVKGSITGPLSNIFTRQTRMAPLWDLVSDWITPPFLTTDYKQSINLEQTNMLNNFTIVSMALSVLPSYAKPYVTVTIRQLQILAEYTSITVGNTLQNRSCDKFTYWYNYATVTKKIETFICQMYTNDNTTNNNIRIDYPIFSNMLGPQFPYDQVFTYAYASDIDGSLQAIRRETADKVLINLCRTNKATEYNIDELGRQLEIFRIQIDPVLLSPSTYTKIRVIMTVPSGILPIECSATEAIFSQKLKCTVIPAANIVLELELFDTTPIKLLDFYIYLNCQQAIGAVSILPNTKYQVQIWLPHTSLTATQVIYGQLFSSFKSIAYKCQNTFTYINAAYNKTILISKYQLNSVALNLNTELQFTMVFSKQKSTLLKNSRIEFRFDGLEANEETFCYLVEFQHVFWKKDWTVSAPGVPSTYWLLNDVDVPSLTDNPVTVKCSNLILTSLSATKPTLAISVYDVTGTIEIMTSLDGVPAKILTSTPFYPASTAITLSTGTVSAKEYTTMGFNGQYTLTYNIAGTGLVEGFIDLSEYSVDPRTVGCKLNVAQDIFCKVYELNTNISLEYRTRFIYFKTYYITSSPTIVITIYPALQEKQGTAPKIHTIMKIGTNLHYIAIIDTLPLLLVNDIFFINNYNVIPVTNLTSVMFNLDITYQFATAVNQPLFVQLNEIFFYTSITGVVLKCTINGTVIPCTAVQKDLIKVNTFAYAANSQYMLRIESLQPNYQIILRDKQNFFIRCFVIDSSTKEIDYVSYLNTDLVLATTLMTLIKSYQASVNKPSLIWNLTDSNGMTFLPKIYIGYYGAPIDLIVYDSSKFVNEFTVASNTYNSSGFICNMGFTKCSLSLIADSFASVIRKYQFLHTNTYYLQPPLLEVEVSNQKCNISAEFTNYKIFQNGITLPIILNFTHCRPRQMIKITYTLLNPDVKIDDSLSELQVTPDNPIGIIFVRHSSTVLTLINYTMTLALTGTYASSFSLTTPSIIIEKISRTESSIQAKLPEVLTLAENETTVRIQCNEPSTVYWAIGFYPTTLGEEGQDIQTRLLNGQIGLRTSITDPLTYGNLEYGMTYTSTPNVWKSLNIKNLLGNSIYTFKYFCVNIKGSFSDGQIINITAPQSTYQMVKLTLGFPNILTFNNVNDYACAISESLTIPYTSTKSSVSTNCKTAPLIFYTSYFDYVRDFNTSGDKVYYYNSFYIQTTTETSQQIVTIIRDKLKNNSRILKEQIPLWEVFNIEQTQPDAITPSIEGQVSQTVYQEEITIVFPIKNQQYFVVIGLLSSYFNPITMSLPETYMIKSGKFSESVNFDKTFMNYTTNEIVFDFQGLTSNTNYSIFYFITVDNPAINAKHSQVKYINLVTKPFLTIDLGGNYLIQNVYLLVGVLLVFVYLS